MRLVLGHGSQRYVYLIKRRDDQGGYDENIAVVVIARDSKKARELASLCHRDEGRDLWLRPESAKLTKLGDARAPNGRSPAIERVVCIESIDG